MAEPSWQETLRLRLAERNARESAFASIIEQCQYCLCLLLAIVLISQRPQTCPADQTSEGEECILTTRRGLREGKSKQFYSFCTRDE